MKSITHNLLFCNKKTCINNEKNYPLILKAIDIENKKIEYKNKENIITLFKKMDIDGLNQFITDLNIEKKFDLNEFDKNKENNDFIEYLNNILNEVQIVNGFLICKNCGRQYEIKNGIVDMVLKDDEI